MDAIINWSLLVLVLALAALPLFLGLAAAVGYVANCAVRRLTGRAPPSRRGSRAQKALTATTASTIKPFWTPRKRAARGLGR